jgi:hypothetical protein
MNIAQAKEQVKDTIEAYLARDVDGRPIIETSRQRPVFLVGAPGIGKTAIMEQISQELGIGIVSYSMTHHTRQSALGLPFIVHRNFRDFDYDASEYTMSEIIASVYEYMERSGIDRGILFLDEINCVSETLYPSMLQFLQFKTFGRHKIPDGWVIVTAGNPPEYNNSVHEFDIVTLDRIKKIKVDPDYAAWKGYATQKGIHAAIVTFLEIKKDRFYAIETTLDGKSFVTARGWDDLSDIIVLYERLGKTVNYDLISQYVQNDRIAREFALYYDLFAKYRSDYRIEEILAGVEVADIIARAAQAPFDERLSLLGLLLDAVVGDMKDALLHEDVLMGLRDVLRDMKKRISEDDEDVLIVMQDAIQARTVALQTALASNSITRTKRDQAEVIIKKLIVLEEMVKRDHTTGPKVDFSEVEQLFGAETMLLKSETDRVENELHNAFSFIGAAFGEKQEMLIFVTELTTRSHAAQFIGRYGSEAYFAHNADLMLDDRKSDLQRRIEELGL